MTPLYQRYALNRFATGQSIGQDAALKFFLHELAFAAHQPVLQRTLWQRLDNLDPLRPSNLDAGSIKAGGDVRTLVDNQRGSAVCLQTNCIRSNGEAVAHWCHQTPEGAYLLMDPFKIFPRLN